MGSFNNHFLCILFTGVLWFSLVFPYLYFKLAGVMPVHLVWLSEATFTLTLSVGFGIKIGLDLRIHCQEFRHVENLCLEVMY